MEPSQAGIDDKILALIKEQAASWVRDTKDIMILYFSQSRGGSTSMDLLKLAREHLID
jgi:hypothetical protein